MTKCLTIEGEPSTADCSGMELEETKNVPSSLRRLDISDNSLTSGALDFTTATNLTWLDLKSNKLSSLAGLETLQSIQVLNLGANKLTSIASIASFGKNLKALILNNNFLATLPDLSPLTNLNTLVLSHNNLTSLPKPFPRLLQLKKLSISNNNLTEYPTFTIPPPPIQELRLSHNQIKSLPTKNPKASSTYTINQLKTLDLGSNSLDNLENLTASLAILAPPNTIVNLNFKGNPVVESSTAVDAGDESKGYKFLVIGAGGSSLKVLDGVRFDSKFLERKEKRKESGWLLKKKQEEEEDKEDADGAADSVVEKARKTPKTSANSEKATKKKANFVNPASDSLKKTLPSSGIVKSKVANTASKSVKGLAEKALPRVADKKQRANNDHLSVSKKPSSAVSNSTSNPLKRKSANDESLPHPKPTKKSSITAAGDDFFKESFKPKAPVVTPVTTTVKPAAVQAQVSETVKKAEKQLDKYEEKLRSGVVGVVEVKSAAKKVSGGKVLKSLKVEDLEQKPAAATSGLGTGLAPGWD